jgi:hypothetical protein
VTPQLDCVDILHTEYIPLLYNGVFYDFVGIIGLTALLLHAVLNVCLNTTVRFCRYAIVNCDHTHIYFCHPITGHQGPRGGVEVSLSSFSTSALEGAGDQHHTPVASPPGKPLYRRLGGPQGWSGRARKISPPPGFDPRTFQPVVSLYTD